jgi:hypothetical protein
VGCCMLSLPDCSSPETRHSARAAQRQTTCEAADGVHMPGVHMSGVHAERAHAGGMQRRGLRGMHRRGLSAAGRESPGRHGRSGGGG